MISPEHLVVSMSIFRNENYVELFILYLLNCLFDTHLS